MLTVTAVELSHSSGNSHPENDFFRARLAFGDWGANFFQANFFIFKMKINRKTGNEIAAKSLETGFTNFSLIWYNPGLKP